MFPALGDVFFVAPWDPSYHSSPPLGDFDVNESRKLRLPNGTLPRGYHTDDFRETWDRYLPNLDTD